MTHFFNNLSVCEKLRILSVEAKNIQIRELFLQDSERFTKYSVETPYFIFDYSKHLVTDEIMNTLAELAEQANVTRARNALFSGEKVNVTESQAALHTLLRTNESQKDFLNADNQSKLVKIHETQLKMKLIADKVHSKNWLGFTGKAIDCVVNIGVGGSYLGLKAVLEGISNYHTKNITYHFIANIDPNAIYEKLKRLNPETTLFIIASKSFGTLETLLNAKSAKKWMLKNGCSEKDIHKHFIAVSSNIQKVLDFGIVKENILPLWDWVGGRYSLWSSIGLILCLVTGFETFERLLKGANAMDEHFIHEPLKKNIPVISALLGIWYQNFMNAGSHAVIAYDHYLRFLPEHIQQLEMESSGKSKTQGGSGVQYQTGSVIWGGVGTSQQHSCFQLLHQGTRLIPVDFIVSATNHNNDENHAWLIANALAQSQALMQGKTLDEAKAELRALGKTEQEVERLASHKEIRGNRPSSTILLNELTPEAIGALIAMYEHKVFVQSVIWNINPFDQWGVELGKDIANKLITKLKTSDPCTDQDASTNGLINRVISKLK